MTQSSRSHFLSSGSPNTKPHLFKKESYSTNRQMYIQEQTKNNFLPVWVKMNPLDSATYFSFSSVTQSCPTLWPHGLQNARLPCPSPTPWAYSNSCPSCQWCHPTISSSVIPSPPSFNLSQHQGLTPLSQFFASGGQSIGVSASASVLLMNIQDWFPLGWTSLIFSLSKRLFRVFSNTTVQKHQFFGTQPSLWSNFHIHMWLLEKP